MTGLDQNIKRAKTQIKKVELGNWVLYGFALGIIAVLSATVAQVILPPEIPLYYARAEGADQLANKLSLVLPGFIAVATLAVNTVLSTIAKDVFIKKILVVSGFALVLLAFVTTIQIIFLVGSF